MMSTFEQETVESDETILKACTELLTKGVAYRLRAKGSSMHPFIRNGDFVTISPLSGAKIGLGEIIAYKHPYYDKLIVHRIIGKEKDRYIVKGDNSKGKPEIIPIANIIGRIIYSERSAGKVMLGLGVERYLIALCSRMGIMRVIISLMTKIL